MNIIRGLIISLIIINTSYLFNSQLLNKTIWLSIGGRKCWHKASHHHMEIICISINTKNTHNESRHKFKTRLCLLISGALSNTLDRHVQGSLHSCRPMIFYVAWTLIPKSTTPVVPLHHFSHNARKWAVFKSLSKRTE